MSPLPQQLPELGFYYHYKHDPAGLINNYAYEVIGVGFHTEEHARPGEEHFLIYRPLYQAYVYKASQELSFPCFDARPLTMWMEHIVKDGVSMPRFHKITDESVIAELQRIRDEMYPH